MPGEEGNQHAEHRPAATGTNAIRCCAPLGHTGFGAGSSRRTSRGMSSALVFTSQYSVLEITVDAWCAKHEPDPARPFSPR